MKLVFWGSSDFSMPSLKKLAEFHEIAAVVTNPDKYYGRGMKKIHQTEVKQFASEKGIPVLQPLSLREEEFYRELKKIGADLFVVVSYGRIIPERIIDLPRYRSVNLHASLLPKYRGASPVQAALLHGERVTGNTVQRISKELDKGPILAQEEEKILETDRAPSLFLRLSEKGANLLLSVVNRLESGTIEERAQNESEASYCGILKKDDGAFSFVQDTADVIMNKFRAYYPWPGIFTFFQASSKSESIRVILTEIELVKSEEVEKHSKKAKKDLVIAAKEGAIRILKLKPVGKKEMDSAAFMNGYFPGDFV